MNGREAKRARGKLGLTQAEFWGRVGLTQSGGSRHENGRRVPKPVRMLLVIAYGAGAKRDRVLRQLEVGQR